jgi:malate dehydrogenase
MNQNNKKLVLAALGGAAAALIGKFLFKKITCKSTTSAFGGKEVINVCVTGAAGQIGYALIPMICSGQVFGHQKINLKLLDIPQAEKTLKGIELEIQDGAYKNIVSLETGSDPKALFKDLDFGIFVGGFPRKQGMERKELLQINGKIFKEQGAALEAVANPNCKIVVVANPANTNCLILAKNAPKIPKENFTCLTRLDHNRAVSQIAMKAGVPNTQVKNVTIWGNHSSTQYPDVNHGTIAGKPIREAIHDHKYLNEDFVARVQKRGAEVLAARGGSSVFSAANAVKDHIHTWIFGTCSTSWTSMGIYSNGEYGAPKDVIFSFPVRCHNGVITIVKDLAIDSFSASKIKATGEELLQEKDEAFA